ncbi:MAG TPA: hypothetical protein VGL40_08295 [Bacillota bacterium]
MGAVLDVQKAMDLDRPDLYLYAPLVKIDEEKRLVFGYVSSDRVDLDGQIADAEWLKRELPDWFRWGNIREMHQLSAVGVAKDLEWDEKGPFVVSKVVDGEAWKKVKEGVYKGYSIGIKGTRTQLDAKAPHGRIVGGKIIEISYVDRPANEDGRFTLFKSVGLGEWKDMQTGVVVKKAALSHEDIRDAIQGKLNPKSDSGAVVEPVKHRWIVETYPDHVIVQENVSGKYYKIPYTISEAGEVTLGDPQEVEQTYVPVSAKAAVAEAYKAAFEAPGRELGAVPEADFGDPKNRRFPITAAKDVVDAVRLIGAADDPGTVKAAIVRIARRKGKEFEDALPASWTEDKKAAKEGNDVDKHCKCGRAMKAAEGGGMVCPECGKPSDECECEKETIGKAVAGESVPAAKAAGGDQATQKTGTAGVQPTAKMDYQGETVLKAIKDQLDALAAQVDAALKSIAPADKGDGKGVPITGHAAPVNPTTIKSSTADQPGLDGLVAAEVQKALSPDSLGKALTADSVKAILTDVAKTAAEAAVGGIRERLEKLEQTAAPAKGNVIEIDKVFAGNPAAGDIQKAVNVITATAKDNSEQAQLARASAIYSLTQLARKG